MRKAISTCARPEGRTRSLQLKTKVERSVSTSELLAEAAGVRITMTAPAEHDVDIIYIKSSSREKVVLPVDVTENDGRAPGCEKEKKSCGFHLTRSKWDPYPWVGFVEPGSIAHEAGLRAGDCLLEVCGRDVVGLRVKEIATLIQNRAKRSIDLEVWRSPEVITASSTTEEFPDDDLAVNGVKNCDPGVALQGPLPEVARKLANAVSGTVKALECPICLESAAPPVSQCVHGHILCSGCRSRTDRCPVCRVRLGQGRCLLADKVHGTLREAFELGNGESHLGEKLFGRLKRGGGKTGVGDNKDVRTGARHLLARLFLGVGVERSMENKAASAENLSVIVNDEEHKNSGGTSRRLIAKRLGELSSSDRAKSASTGELANPVIIRGLDNELRDFPSSSNPDVTFERGARGTGSLLSVPQTPTWGGSTESISNAFVRCPLAQNTRCTELVTPGFLLEHLGTAHQGPQVHFYSGTATVSVPTPLGPDAIYVLHHAGEIFIFKCDEESAWIITTGGGSRQWDWYLRGWGADGTEVKLRRSVVILEEHSQQLTPQQTAPLPKALNIRTIEIQLVESCPGEVARM
ncbi:uncharacterized protein LOC105689075 isoform X2 [Athalia rosae]|uniref:uncharacterized protein LOC105689075 isoform X2 n=1 Tax=Athalia rosae TaxID=37344 RepID=UPI0020332A47|nr:uncharacterized protein LOC105689075 isoform X2 [Athalia rosae]